MISQSNSNAMVTAAIETHAVATNAQWFATEIANTSNGKANKSPPQ